MIARSILALALAAWFGGAPSDLREVQIAPAGADTEITVVVGGEIEVHHFLLADPARLILDVEGASHDLDRHSYGAIGRGGVIRLRSSQFRPDVVRLVFDLTRELEYTVEKTQGKVRVRFENVSDPDRPPRTTWLRCEEDVPTKDVIAQYDEGALVEAFLAAEEADD